MKLTPEVKLGANEPFFFYQRGDTIVLLANRFHTDPEGCRVEALAYFPDLDPESTQVAIDSTGFLTRSKNNLQLRPRSADLPFVLNNPDQNPPDLTSAAEIISRITGLRTEIK